MSRSRITLALVVLGFALSTPIAAQGLGDTAAREKAKRSGKTQGKKEPAKVFTNEDLAQGRPPGSKPDSGGSPASSESEGRSSSETPEVAEDDRQAQERQYLDAINSANSEVTHAQTRVRQLSDKLNPMSVSYIYGAGGSNDPNEELRVREELRQAERDLEQARQQVVVANKNLQDFRQGRPPAPPE